jgi:DNA-directed RNA polymerase I, II, and III subunit RPABC2
MSDDEYNSDINSGSEDSDNEIVIPSTKKSLFKPSINIKSYTKGYNDIDDSEPDDAEPEEEDEEENIVGGADEIVSEDEASDIEEGEVQDDDDDDDAEPEEDNNDDDSDIEIDEDGEPIQKVPSQKTKGGNKTKKPQLIVMEDEDEDEDEYDENYLQKFDNEIIKNYVNEFHPECLNNNYEEIQKLTIVTKNSDGIIIDPLHRTIPYLTKYERARILGQRAKQIETGAKPLVSVPENIVDSYIIAELELREKKIPFIIRRPIPGGACEYWNLKDLEVIAF